MSLGVICNTLAIIILKTIFGLFESGRFTQVLLYLIKVNEYDEEVPQSHTADQHTSLRGGATELLQLQYTKKTTEVKKPALSSSSKLL